MLRNGIADRVGQALGIGQVAIERAPDDPGLFGPGSASWRVHGDVPSMLVGGVAALLLQTLHPRALAGVWDHSNWRRDAAGRLKRTAAFVGVTTFGGTAQAEAAVARVRRIHERVQGCLPAGEPYSANEPALVTWVHACEVAMFVAAHLRYRDSALPGAEQDRYLAEQARLARMLGAEEPPESRAALARYFREVRPELRADERSHEVSRLILAQPSASLMTAPMGAVTMRAAVDLLPGWASRMHGLRLSLPDRAGARAGAMGMGAVLRWAMG